MYKIKCQMLNLEFDIFNFNSINQNNVEIKMHL